MSQTFSWGAVGSVMNLLTTEMNALGNGTFTAAGPEIDNTVSGFQLGTLSLHVASASFVANSLVFVYLVPSIALAGTTYPTLDSTNAGNYLAGTILVQGTTAAHNETLPNVSIPLGKFKTLLVTGGACPTLAGTLNTLNLYPTPTIVG